MQAVHNFKFFWINYASVDEKELNDSKNSLLSLTEGQENVIWPKSKKTILSADALSDFFAFYKYLDYHLTRISEFYFQNDFEW